MDSTTTSTTTSHLVAVPFPGRGHINPMLNLCDLLLSSTTSPLTITFVVTEEWLSLLTPSLHPNIHFCTIPNVLPSERVRGADHNAFLRAVDAHMESPTETLVSRLHPPPTSIIADTYLAWAVSVANRQAVSFYSFFPMSPSFFSFLLHFHLVDDRQSLPFTSPSLRKSDFEPLLANEEAMEYCLRAMKRVVGAQGLVFNAFYGLEPRVVDILRRELPCQIHTLGPTIPFGKLAGDGGDEEYFSWLGSQPEGSVLYVSLGSFVAVSDELIEALALGLRDSGVRFLWSARGDVGRMRQLCGGKGVVVEWCDQLRVLCHPSVGVFLSHCGWNSTLEGVFSGKPIIALPLFWDQIPDAALIAEEWKIGVRFKNGVGREEIAMAIRKVMDLDGDESKEMRKRSRMLMENCRQAIGDGGSSVESLNGFLESLSQKSD